MNSSEPRGGPAGSAQSSRRMACPSGAIQRLSRAPGGRERRSNGEAITFPASLISASCRWLLFGKPRAVNGYRGNGVSMLDEPFKYGLLAALAIALLVAAFSDLRSRRIAKWLTGTIALGAPPFWWASAMPLWADPWAQTSVAAQLGVAAFTFAILAVLFAIRAMGGGDVKLLTALALWIEPPLFL